MVRALTCCFLFSVLGCAGAPVTPVVRTNPDLVDQKLLSDVVAAAFAGVDGLDLRKHVNGKNVAVQVATTYSTETSMVRAQAALLLTRAGAIRADLQRGGDLIALIILRAYGVQRATVDDGEQNRAFLIGELVLQRPGRGEIYRTALGAKAVDHFFADGGRERRNVGRSAAPEPKPEPEPELELEPEPQVAAAQEPEPEPEPVVERRTTREPPRSKRSKRRGTDKSRSSRSRRKRDEEADDEEEDKPKADRRSRRRRRRQPLILE
ncbi:MAG: hypothetical protein OSB21_08035 [Myxococcota bacterium]|nr:hypothetical protein [Myxococcota bacterium]